MAPLRRTPRHLRHNPLHPTPPATQPPHSPGLRQSPETPPSSSASSAPASAEPPPPTLLHWTAHPPQQTSPRARAPHPASAAVTAAKTVVTVTSRFTAAVAARTPLSRGASRPASIKPITFRCPRKRSDHLHRNLKPTHARIAPQHNRQRPHRSATARKNSSTCAGEPASQQPLPSERRRSQHRIKPRLRSPLGLHHRTRNTLRSYSRNEHLLLSRTSLATRSDSRRSSSLSPLASLHGPDTTNPAAGVREYRSTLCSSFRQ